MRSAIISLLLLALAAIAPAQEKPPNATPSFAGRSLDAWVGGLKDPHPLVREEALEVIAQLGPAAKTAADAVRPLLKDPLTTTRVRAAIALWKIERKGDYLPLLADAARGATVTTRLLILDALKQFASDSKDSAPVLVAFLDADEGSRRSVTAALNRLGLDALPAFSSALERDNFEVVRQVLPMIGNLGPRAADNLAIVRGLHEKLKDKSPLLRLLAARTLYLVVEDADASLPVIVDAARNDDDQVRQEAFQGLMLFKPVPKAAVPALEAGLKDRDPFLRVRSADLLFEYDGRTTPLLSVLLAAVTDPGDPTLRTQARSTLGMMQSAAGEIVPALVEALKEHPPAFGNIGDTGYVLGRMGDAAVGPLVKMFEERNPPLRRMALFALPETGDKGAVFLARALLAQTGTSRGEQLDISSALARYRGNSEPVAAALTVMLRSKNALLVERVLTTLYAYGPRAAGAMPNALEIIKDDKRTPQIRAHAAALMLNVGPAAKAAVPALTALVEDEKAKEIVRLEAVRVLGSIGPHAKPSLPALLELMKDTKPNVRLTVLQALADIQPDHEALAPGLLAALNDRKGRYQEAMSALHLLGSDAGPAVPALVEMLAKEKDSLKKNELIGALGRIGPEARAAAPALKALLKEKSTVQGLAAALALTRIGVKDREVLNALLGAIKSGQFLKWTDLAEALGHFEKELGEIEGRAEAAEKALSRWRVTRSIDLAEIVLRLKPKESAEVAAWLRQLPVHFHTGPRVAVLLWRIDPKTRDGLPSLARQLRDPNNLSARAMAAHAASQLGPAARELLAGLEAAIEVKFDPRSAYEEEHYVNLRIQAAHALARVEPKQSARAAAVLLDAVRTEASTPAHIRTQAVTLLADLKPETPAILSGLIEAYPQQPALVRRAIREAIRRIDPNAISKLP